jgi:transcription elongation GreA/GreB family factor
MRKIFLKKMIIDQLKADYALLLQAARAAHEAATHEDNIPDSKYETLALEASYIAQGQANRAGAIAAAIHSIEQMDLRSFNDASEVGLGALVSLVDEQEREKLVFLAPAAGGLSVHFQGKEVVLITPGSPLGQGLIGLSCGDSVEVSGKQYEIIELD